MKNALVIGVDRGSRLVNLHDRRTSVFFGDGAGAAVVSGRGAGRVLASKMYSRGTSEPLSVPVGGEMSMDGKAVWDFATDVLPATVRELCASAGVSVDCHAWADDKARSAAAKPAATARADRMRTEKARMWTSGCRSGDHGFICGEDLGAGACGRAQSNGTVPYISPNSGPRNGRCRLTGVLCIAALTRCAVRRLAITQNMVLYRTVCRVLARSECLREKEGSGRCDVVSAM